MAMIEKKMEVVIRKITEELGDTKYSVKKAGIAKIGEISQV
jgi:hypothetical protein